MTSTMPWTDKVLLALMLIAGGLTVAMVYIALSIHGAPR